MFKDFPEDVEWWQAVLSRADLERIKYLNDDYWTEFSGGSRLVRDAARRIASGEGEDVAAGYRSLAHSLALASREGPRPPEPIVQDNPETEELVVLEGHVRMTAYLLLPADLLPELPALVGRSDQFSK